MNWNELNKVIQNCHKCNLSQARTHVVIGQGNKKADLLIVGEGPGKNEDLQGEPFVGKAGQLLDKILEAVQLSRSEVYITNIVKCRPPDNRDPKTEEKESCLPYLRAQFLLIRPKIILCLGRIAAQTLIDPSFKITKQHGEWFEKKNVYMMATFHPAALLRDPSRKRAVWEDMQKLKAKYDELKS
ncbi:MAG: uracil-DNA glycosylase family protein [Clostridia bacterium]